MLNDAISLGIALYAIKVCPQKFTTLSPVMLIITLKLSKRTANSQYSYGWHRAEVLAALVNGVFLLALCFSILLESLERFAHVPGMHYEFLDWIYIYRIEEVKDPKLIVIGTDFWFLLCGTSLI